MHRAFASWAQNHPLINFVEVTEVQKWHIDQACPSPRSGSPTCATAAAASRNRPSRPHVVRRRVGRRGADGGRARPGDGRALGRASAEPPPPPAARQLPGSVHQRRDAVRGGRRRDVREAGDRDPHAVLSFNVDQLCWYLDSAWCHHFHSLKPLVGGAATLLLIIRCVLFSLWALAIAAICPQFGRVVCKTCDHGSWVERIRGTMDVIGHWSVIMTTIRFILLVGPPAIYWMILLPCWDCYDFEGAATHEVGHVLGLSHPDFPRGRECLAGPDGQRRADGPGRPAVPVGRRARRRRPQRGWPSWARRSRRAACATRSWRRSRSTTLRCASLPTTWRR